jgi:deazaflavin-dependent oxidoreductase (nitroreductase family)
MPEAAATRLRSLRPFARRFVNPVTRLFAGRLPGFAILAHVGRRSGRTFSMPINVFRRDDHYLFALTYGAEVDWLKNVLAAGGCQIRTGGRVVRLVEPEVVFDPELRLVSRLARPILRFDRVTEILRMRAH